MANIDYDNKRFSPVESSASGDVSGKTVFLYHQEENLVWAEYSGGGILFGNLIAICDEKGGLDMRYQHINSNGELMTGVCSSTPELLGDGRIRLNEKWRWTSGDCLAGESVLEESDQA